MHRMHRHAEVLAAFPGITLLFERMGRDFADPVSSMLVDLAIVPVECTGIEHPQRSFTIRALSRALVTLEIVNFVPFEHRGKTCQLVRVNELRTTLQPVAAYVGIRSLKPVKIMMDRLGDLWHEYPDVSNLQSSRPAGGFPGTYARLLHRIVSSPHEATHALDGGNRFLVASGDAMDLNLYAFAQKEIISCGFKTKRKFSRGTTGSSTIHRLRLPDCMVSEFPGAGLHLDEKDGGHENMDLPKHQQGTQFTSSYNLYDSNLEPTSATAVINVTTDVVQIQDNGNDLEEEGGNYFRATATVATTAAMTVTTTATAMAATAARPVAAMVAATAAATATTTQPRKRGRPKGSKDKEPRKRRQKATGGGVILRPLAAKKSSMPTVHRFKGFMIAQMYRL
ncbi:hypothetical protein V8E54_004898 [Elaphomyces granulatus]